MPQAPDPVELSGARRQLGFGLLFSLGLLLGGAWATFHPNGALEDRIGGTVMMLVGALFLWATLSPPKATEIGLRLDADGVHSKNPLNGYAFDLPWSEVTGVRIELYDGQRLVVLDAKDPLRDLDDAGELGRETRRKRLAAVGSRFVVPANLLGLSPEALRDAIAPFVVAYGSR